MADDRELIPMQVRGLMLDPVSNVPMVILRDESNERFLPIWIGAAEANAIILELEGVAVPRPMTHDLALALVETLGGSLEQIVVTDLAESTFYAQLTLGTESGRVRVDSRPSDAIALALRAGAPIFVDAEVLEKAKTDTQTKRLSDRDELEKFLEDLDEEDLGKYKM